MVKEDFDEIFPDESKSKILKSADMTNLKEEKIKTNKLSKKDVIINIKTSKLSKKDMIINKLDNALNLLSRNPRNRREVMILISESIELIKQL